jgi:hypothetical protein
VVNVEGAAEEEGPMKLSIAMICLGGSVALCAAGDPTPQNVPRPRQATPADVPTPPAAQADRAAPADAPKFVSEAKWLLAGYNNNEIVYTILVTNQDLTILRCTTQMQGYYFENGQKLTIADRQVTTVFPNQSTQVGNWMDMDQSSGATYSVTCKRV